MRSLWLALLLAACGDSTQQLVHGTATRMEVPPPRPSAEGMELKVFQNLAQCSADPVRDPADRDICIPYVDRGEGQVRLSFQVSSGGQNYAVPLEPEQVEVYHNGFLVQPGVNEVNDVQVIPHGPRRASQLFVLIIDTSGSMNLDDGTGIPRIERVRRALTARNVVDAFFPKDDGNGSPIHTAVVPLVFAGGDPVPLGGRWVVDDPAEYVRLVNGMQIGRGYTFLYHSIDYALQNVVRTNPEVSAAIRNYSMQPTLIALTDGFNDEFADQTCSANVQKLRDLLKSIQKSRKGAKVTEQPYVYTVGLGHRAWPDPPGRRKSTDSLTEITAAELCPGGLGYRVIDGDIETFGVDNLALDRIARVGAGRAFVRSDAKGLAEAFEAAAAMRYQWFELHYQYDVPYFRREFPVRIQLNSLSDIAAEATMYPSGWLDGPPGESNGKDKWTHAAPFRYSLRLLLPAIAALLVLGYLPAAGFNARRPFRAKVGP